MSWTPEEPRPPQRSKPRPPQADDELIGRASAAQPKRSGSADRSREPRPASGGPSWIERLLFGRVSAGHLALFCRQLASYLDAGVDPRKALVNLEAQFARTALGPVIGRLGSATRRGEPLADAVAREPQAFDPLFLSLIRVAEARGGVPETLRSLSKHYEDRQRLIRQAASAMIYPAGILVAIVGVCVLLTYFVLPALVGMLDDMTRGKEMSLPLPTRLLMGFTHLMASFGWWVVPLNLVALGFGLRFLYKSEGGKRILDELIVRLPGLGLLFRKIETTRFARSLGALLDGGVPIGPSLDLTADVVRLSPYRSAVQSVRQAVDEGQELSEALRATGRFSPDLIAIVESGEETGMVPETLDHLADDYEEQVAHLVRNLGLLLQPLILLVLGGIVFFIALAFVMAYVSVIMNLASP